MVSTAQRRVLASHVHFQMLKNKVFKRTRVTYISANKKSEDVQICPVKKIVCYQRKCSNGYFLVCKYKNYILKNNLHFFNATFDELIFKLKRIKEYYENLVSTKIISADKK